MSAVRIPIEAIMDGCRAKVSIRMEACGSLKKVNRAAGIVPAPTNPLPPAHQPTQPFLNLLQVEIKVDEAPAFPNGSGALVTSLPRQTGSLSSGHAGEDALTRIRNIDAIQLGKYRIKPW